MNEYGILVKEDPRTILYVSGPRMGTYAVLQPEDDGAVLFPEAIFWPLDSRATYRALVVILSEFASGRIGIGVLRRVAEGAKKWRAVAGPLLEW